MSIQANINQGISLAGLLLSQTPMAATQREKQAEAQRIETEKGRIGKQIENATKLKDQALVGIKTQLEEVPEGMTGEELDMGDFSDVSIYNKQQVRLGELYERMATIDPTDENFDKYTQQITEAKEAEKRMKNPQTLYQLKNGGVSMSQKRDMAKSAAADAGKAEAARLAESRNLTNMLDLSKLDERTIDRVNRAYKRAERDTKYLTKKDGGNQ